MVSKKEPVMERYAELTSLGKKMLMKMKEIEKNETNQQQPKGKCSPSHKELREFDAPFKDKIVCCSAYKLMNLLMKKGVDKAKAIVILDNIINHQKVVLREINFPKIKFRQIHMRKTKGKPDVHVQIVRTDYKLLRHFLKKLDKHHLFTTTTNNDASIGNFNAFAEMVKHG